MMTSIIPIYEIGKVLIKMLMKMLIKNIDKDIEDIKMLIRTPR